MKFLVIGLGSMGKRRIRNLKALGESDIFGFDIQKQRCEEVLNDYKIQIVDSININVIKDFDVLFVCTSPAEHAKYINLAIDGNKHCFVEASVVCDGLHELADRVEKTDLKIYASCTLRFHPAIKKIKKLIEEGKIGKLSNFSYHSGQYLPDWHPWEDIRDYYVSKKETSGCREIVPFELTWLNDIFGNVDKITGIYGKTIDLVVDIDDVYALAIKYKSGIIGTLLVDVVSRFAIRQIIINGDKGQISWNWNADIIEHYNADSNQWESHEVKRGMSAVGYNNNIIEEMYIDEVSAFLNAIRNQLPVKNSLRDDIYTLGCLYTAEQSQSIAIS